MNRNSIDSFNQLLEKLLRDNKTNKYANFYSKLNENISVSYLARVLSEIWNDTPPIKSVNPDLLKFVWYLFHDRGQLLDDLIKYSDSEKFENDMPNDLLIFELLLIRGKYDEISVRTDHLSIRHIRDLRLQDVRARSLILKNMGKEKSGDIDFACLPFKGYFCPPPFERFEPGDGITRLCCGGYMHISAGNPYEQDFDEIWNSDIALAVRESILSGSYEYCNKMLCPKLQNFDLIKSEDINDEYLQNIIRTKDVKFPTCYPRIVFLQTDIRCNLKCPSCRSGYRQTETNYLKNVEDNILKEVFAYNLKTLQISTSGDPFASPHYIRILKSLDPEKNKIDSFIIMTNGLLLNEKRWDSIRNIHGYNRLVLAISIDAAEKDTYEKLRSGGKWDILQENLNFISKLRKTNKISMLVFNFVVQNDNYKEMIKFIDMSREFGVDKIHFSQIASNPAMTKEYFEYQAIQFPTHENHDEFVLILNSPAFEDEIINLNNLLYLKKYSQCEIVEVG